MSTGSLYFLAILILFEYSIMALHPSARIVSSSRGSMVHQRLEYISMMATSGDDDTDLPEIDLEALMQNSNLPKPPQNPDEIEADSFEGFLREEFYSILEDSELLDFTGFYVWRCKMGIVYSEEEMIDLFTSITQESGTSGLDLMNFIKINRIIDEGNAAIEDGRSF